MWAALELPIPLRPRPPSTRSNIKHRCLSVAVQSLRPNDREEGIGGLGQAMVLKAVKSNGLGTTAPAERQHPPPPSRKQKGAKEQQQQRDLRGADILWALERASARKANRKKKEKKDSYGVIEQKGPESEDESVGVQVRPLRIKSQWSDRLMELERRLEELIHS